MRPVNDYLRHPTGPWMGLWSWRYLDILRTFRLVTSRRVRNLYQRFPTLHPPGTSLPSFTLKDLDGVPHSVSEFLGKKHLVITTGAFT